MKKIYKNSTNFRFIKNLVKDSYINYNLDNTFCVFNSINNILYLIYSKENKSIIAFDIMNNQIINEIKRAHKNYISNFRHYLDEINNRDLIISLSELQSEIKLWDIKNFECLLNIKNIYVDGNLFSACFLKDNNKIYIVASKYNFSMTRELIKVYDFNGNKVKTINYSNDQTLFIDSYFDNRFSRNYIITCNKGYIKSYNYKENKIYHKYFDNNNALHLSSIIYDKEKIIQLIESSTDGFIRIWNFHSKELLNKIQVEVKKCLYGICLWDNENLLVGCEDNKVKLVDLKNGSKTIELIGHNNKVFTIKKVNHPKYGEYLLSQGSLKDGIKIWINDI